jgi:hypothetical protein
MLDVFILDFIVSSSLCCNLGSHRHETGSVKAYNLHTV